jgi:4a-hydroxytetrahydrobiopterin dehydratase
MVIPNGSVFHPRRKTGLPMSGKRQEEMTRAREAQRTSVAEADRLGVVLDGQVRRVHLAWFVVGRRHRRGWLVKGVGVQKLSRQDISDAVADLGWRLILGTVRTHVVTDSLAAGADFAGRVSALPGTEGRLLLDIRDDRVVVTVRTIAADWVLPADLELARQITALSASLGLETRFADDPRSPQIIEIGIDALDIAAIRPFWKAVLGYADETGPGDAPNALIDPFFQGPAVWFQQMDAPRPQRNRIHFDVSVPHDEAGRRMAAALAAGGSLVYDEAPAFWVLADPEGNEACVTTWQGRD